MATDDVTSAKSGDSTINNNRIITSVNGFTNNYISTGVNQHETLAEMVSRVDTRFVRSYKPLNVIRGLQIPLELISLLFHDDGTDKKYPAYYTEAEWPEHSHLLKDYSLGVGDLREKREGYCYNFDGVDDYITAGKRVTTGSVQKLFVSCWVKTTQVATATCAILSEFTVTSDNRSWLMYHTTGTGAGKLSILVNGAGPVSGNNTYYGNATINDGIWHHIAFSFDEGSVSAYVDGVQQTLTKSAGTNNPTSLYNSSAHFAVGAHDVSNAPLSRFSGSIFDSRVYEGAAADEAVANIAGIYTGTWKGSPTAHYPLQEESGATAYDISGNGNHGTILNAVTSGVGSIHQPDAGVVKSYANDEGYTDGKVLSYGDILDSTFTAADAYFEIEWEGEIPPADGVRRTVVAKNADSNFSENQRQLNVRWVGNKLGGVYFTELNGSRVRLYETDEAVTSGSTFKVTYDGSLDADQRMKFYVDDVEVAASVIVSTGTITATDDIKNSTAPLAIGSPVNVAQTQYLPSSIGFHHTSVTIRDASSVIFSASRENNWKDTVGNITPLVVHNRKIPSVSSTESAIGTTPQFTGRCPYYGLAKGPAWQGDGSTVYVDLGAPVIPVSSDFTITIPYKHVGVGAQTVFSQTQTAITTGRIVVYANQPQANRLRLAYIDVGNTTTIDLPVCLTVGETHQITATRSGNTLTITCEGSLGTFTNSETPSTLSVAQFNTHLLSYAGSSRSVGTAGPFSITVGGITTTYSPMEGTRNVAVTKSDGTYSVITDAVKNGALATLYSDGDGSWRLPAIENGANYDGTGLYPAAPAASVAANGNVLNIPANKHPIGILVDRTGGVIAPSDYQTSASNYTDEAFNTIPPENTLNKRGLSTFMADRYGSSYKDISNV